MVTSSESNVEQIEINNAKTSSLGDIPNPKSDAKPYQKCIPH